MIYRISVFASKYSLFFCYVKWCICFDGKQYLLTTREIRHRRRRPVIARRVRSNSLPRDGRTARTAGN